MGRLTVEAWTVSSSRIMCGKIVFYILVMSKLRLAFIPHDLSISLLPEACLAPYGWHCSLPGMTLLWHLGDRRHLIWTSHFHRLKHSMCPRR